MKRLAMCMLAIVAAVGSSVAGQTRAQSSPNLWIGVLHPDHSIEEPSDCDLK